MGEYSANNIMPFLYGDVPYKMFQQRVEGDPYYSTSIYKFAKEYNFTTLITVDGCNDDLARYIGRNPTVDHILSFF